MSIESLYRGYGVRVHTDDITPARTIGGINSYNVRDSVQVDRQTTGGDIYATATTKTGHNEEIEISSLDVDDVLEVVGTTGLCLKSANTKTGFELFLSKFDECVAGYSVSSNNLSYAAKASSGTVQTYGLLHPGTLAIPHAGDATMNFMCIPRPSGANAGIVITNNVALPAIVDTGKRFGMGPLTINDTVYNGKTNIDINFGVSIGRQSTDGDMFPSWVAIERVLAVITIRGISPLWGLEANIPRGGRSFAHSTTRISLRRKSPDALGGYFADSESEHITITAKGRAYMTELASGNGVAPSQSALIMYVERDGSNAPLIVTTETDLDESSSS